MLNGIEPILLCQRDPMFSIGDLLKSPDFMCKNIDNVYFLCN